MPKLSTKVTYFLDPATVLEVRELSVAWGVAKSEVVRRAVHAATLQKDTLSDRQSAVLDALDRLQASPGLSSDERKQWVEDVAAERKASSQR
ncbi:MAG: hypothetical protein HN742_35955 [Lentisphaerae bacterium]|jgi:hypothetical protein|nr:hypothetical protein [Lentisphaerota bacterium]MBT5609790.1 hypothetical protein [Lentisphaerota bacterium]MBT7055075.1 hypothetical protein [Lentisphaerota bacterium]MBT7847320.1 hypothetical protein [Lentisphaerota bacterium]